MTTEAKVTAGARRAAAIIAADARAAATPDDLDFIELGATLERESGLRELVEAAEDARRRLNDISRLLNGGAIPDDVRNAYNLAYDGPLANALRTVNEGEGSNHVHETG